MTHTAVIGDLVGSKRLEPTARRDIQRELARHFAEQRPSQDSGLVARPTITLGDEFQALFSAYTRPEALPAFLTRVQDLCRPTPVRFGIGVGTLTTDLVEVAIGMDGPCFHHARDAIEWARTAELPCGVRGGDPLSSDMLTYLASHLLDLRARWTEEQREAIETYLSLDEDERTWARVAERLHRSASAITQRHQGARFDRVLGLSDVVARGLARLERDADGAPS